MFRVGGTVRHLLKSVLAFTFYYTGLIALLRKLNNLRGKRLTIIGLGRILENADKNEPCMDTSAFLVKEDFDKLLAYAVKSYTIISLDQAYTLLRKGQPLPKNALVLTFDGCYEEALRYAYPILRKYNIPATLFLTTDCIRLGKISWWEQIRGMVANGISLGLHAETADLSSVLDKKSWMSTITESRGMIRKKVGYKPKYFAYGDGSYNENVKRMLKTSGYVAALIHRPGINDHDDPFELRRKEICSQRCAGLDGKFSKAMVACELSGVFDLLKGGKTRVQDLLSSDSVVGPIRRAMDVVGALMGAIITLPLAIIIGIIIKLDSPGSALFRQVRVGKNRRPFTFYKFRTMYIDARQRFPELYSYKYKPEEVKTLKFKMIDDPRVTRMGRWLRKTSLDEIPNFINVLIGNMSLVGPRPDIPEMVKYYTLEQMIKLHVKPGITGLAQISGRGRLFFQETLRYDCEYVRNQSLWLDIKIIFKTLRMVIAQDGAF